MIGADLLGVIEEKRYIEIKKLAYGYYEKYNSLERVSRKSFLDALPPLNSALEACILRNTLLFPDTEELLCTKTKGELMDVLVKIAQNEDNIDNHNIMQKASEYNNQKTKKLILEGKLKVMDKISYSDDSISQREYLSLKEEALMFFNSEFDDMSLRQKVQAIGICCEEETYQTQIQLATLIIPDDARLMRGLKTHNEEQLAAYYKVPVSVIHFKAIEYERQGTSDLLKDGKLLTIDAANSWYRSADDEVISGIWDQSFYKEIENKDLKKAESHLSKMYQGYSKSAGQK